jgi:hypothetical protein
MSTFQSSHPIGTVIAIRRKRERMTATLHCRFPNGEEWRITDRRGRYAYSESWPWVREHQAEPAIADVAASFNPPAGALGLDAPFTLVAETPRAPAEAQQDLFSKTEP